MIEPILVCFAVAREAKPFRQKMRSPGSVRTIVTGIGHRNAERAVAQAFKSARPSHVLTCGFAGALDPSLAIGDVTYQSDDPVMAPRLANAGARPIAFCCVDRVAVTAQEKAQLFASTSAAAVEMESGIISEFCASNRVPCSTLRAISDLAGEDLPLDFNKLAGPTNNLSPFKLALAILGAPHKIPALMRLGSNSAIAAKNLAHILDQALGVPL